jgi:hypothetical protein
MDELTSLPISPKKIQEARATDELERQLAEMDRLFVRPLRGLGVL